MIGRRPGQGDFDGERPGAHSLSHCPAHNGLHQVSIRAPWTYTCAGARSPLAETVMHADPALHPDPAALRAELIRRWTGLGADPDSPDRYELSEFGEIILSPSPTTKHQRIVRAVARLLEAQLGPEAVTEVAVCTERGFRVPDVVWMTPERWAGCKDQTPLETVPDVCVEVVSPGNTREEILMKVDAYLRGGARETIVVGLNGEVEHFGPNGKLDASALGLRIELPAELF